MVFWRSPVDTVPLNTPPRFWALKTIGEEGFFPEQSQRGTPWILTTHLLFAPHTSNNDLSTSRFLRPGLGFLEWSPSWSLPHHSLDQGSGLDVTLVVNLPIKTRFCVDSVFLSGSHFDPAPRGPPLSILRSFEFHDQYPELLGFSGTPGIQRDYPDAGYFPCLTRYRTYGAGRERICPSPIQGLDRFSPHLNVCPVGILIPLPSPRHPSPLPWQALGENEDDVFFRAPPCDPPPFFHLFTTGTFIGPIPQVHLPDARLRQRIKRFHL